MYYSKWEDEFITRLCLKRVNYLMTNAYVNQEAPSHSEAVADALKLLLQKAYSLAMSIIFDMTSELPRKMIHSSWSYGRT